MTALDIADAIVGAATATAGLILVFLGATLASFERFSSEAQSSVKQHYQWRGQVAFVGLIVAVAASVFGLVAKWMGAVGLAVAAFVLLTISLALVVYAAYLSVSEIQ